MKNTVENIEDYLKDLDDSELLSINREYLENNKYLDDDIYGNDEEFFEMFFQGRVLEAVRAIHFGDYNYVDAYVKFNGYANLETTNHLADFIDISELAEYIHENPEDFDIEFDEDDEDEEE